MRYIQFDALRGIAALVVVLGHYIGMMPINDYSKAWFIISNLPIRILWDGAGAVNLFFVLSGFCVALPYMQKNNPRPVNYVAFMVRRIFRLYPAYFVALLLSIIAKSFYVHPSIGDISTWGGGFLAMGASRIKRVDKIIFSYI